MSRWIWRAGEADTPREQRQREGVVAANIIHGFFAVICVDVETFSMRRCVYSFVASCYCRIVSRLKGISMSPRRLALVVVALSSAPAFAQIGSVNVPSEFEVRIVPFPGTSLAPGGTTSLDSVSFWLQARSRRPDPFWNFGVARASSGTTRPSEISISGSAWIARAPVDSSGEFFGRGLAFRSADNVGTFPSEFPVGNTRPSPDYAPNSPTGLDANGFWSPQSLLRIDATRISVSDVGTPAGYDPRVPVTDGAWTAWFDIYAFTVNNTAPGPVNISTFFQMRSAYYAGPAGTPFYGIEQPASPASPEFGYTFSFAPTVTPVPLPVIPSPGAIAVFAGSGIICLRRRR